MMNDTCGQHGSSSLIGADPELFSENKSPLPESSDRLVREKICRVCGTLKPYSEYLPNSKGNRPGQCLACLNSKERTRKRRNGAQVKASFKTWRQENRGLALVTVARYRAKRKRLACGLEPTDIQRRINLGVCELTGISFDLTTPRSWNAPSLDRINSSLGYTQENTRVVLFALNVMANTWGENRIVQIANAIVAKRRTSSDNLQERLAAALVKKLPQPAGSTLFSMTWKDLITPAGRRVCRLRASGRRTSDSGCGSWPTPNAGPQNDTDSTWEARRDALKAQHRNGNGFGMTLGMAMTLASWATPTSRDHKDGSPTENVPENALLGRQVWQAIGPISSGSPAETASPGQLNPAFSLWLQGYPSAWQSCAARVIPSSRKSRKRSLKPIAELRFRAAKLRDTREALIPNDTANPI